MSLWSIIVAFGVAVILLLARRSQRAGKAFVLARPKKGFPRLYWVAAALLIWLICLSLIGYWLGQSGLKWWRLETWITPVAELKKAVRPDKSIREIQIDELRNLVAAFIIVIGSFVGAVQLGNALRRTNLLEHQRDATREQTTADIFGNAAEQLGSTEVATRLGAIYSLEALALSDQSQGRTHLTRQIMETIAAFIRERSIPKPPPSQTDPAAAAPITPDDTTRDEVAIDVSAAFAVLTRSYPEAARPPLMTEGGVDLRKSRLKGVRLYAGTSLKQFNLSGCDLREVSFFGCDLEEAWLSGADLTGARLSESRLTGTYFTSTGWGDAKGLTNAMLEDAKWDQGKPPKLPDYAKAI